MQLQQGKQIAKYNLLRKCGLLAHTSPTFLKNCWIKKLLVACGNILGKPPESSSARLGHIPSLPWESQLPLKPCSMLQPSDFEGNCDFSDFLLDFCYCSLFTLCKGQLAPCTPRRAEPARPHFVCGSYLTINSFLQISCQMHQNCKCCLRCSFTPQNPLSQPHRIKSSCLCCFCLFRIKSALAANPQGNLLFSSQRYF